MLFSYNVSPSRHHTVKDVCVCVCMTPLTLAASAITLQCVSFGADAAVRAWQVETLPLTTFLLALIYICVHTNNELRLECTERERDRQNGMQQRADFFLPSHCSLRACAVEFSAVVAGPFL